MSQNNNSEEVNHYRYLTRNFRPRCDSCYGYKEDGETGCLDLGDGRELCSDCSSIAVTNPEECSSIIQSVFEFYRKEQLKVDEKIPIFLIDKNHMRRFVRKKESTDDVHGGLLPSMWDCFPSLLPRLFLGGIQTIKKYPRSGDIKKVWKLALGRGILILFGLPDIKTGEILAHELMHLWIRGQGIPYYGGCERRTEEGLCEVMAHRWLEWFPSSGFDNSHKTNEQVQYTEVLRKHLVSGIECNTDEVYGQGFRDATRAIETYGFKTILDHVIRYRSLPRPIMDSTRSAAAALEAFVIEGIRSRVYKVCVREFIHGIRAVGTVGFRPALCRTLPQLMTDSTCSTNASTTAAAIELTRKNTSTTITPQPNHVSFWVATTMDLIGKAATICEAMGIIMMKGHLLSIGIGIQIQHS